MVRHSAIAMTILLDKGEVFNLDLSEYDKSGS